MKSRVKIIIFGLIVIALIVGGTAYFSNLNNEGTQDDLKSKNINIDAGKLPPPPPPPQPPVPPDFPPEQVQVGDEICVTFENEPTCDSVIENLRDACLKCKAK